MEGLYCIGNTQGDGGSSSGSGSSTCGNGSGSNSDEDVTTSKVVKENGSEAVATTTTNDVSEDDVEHDNKTVQELVKELADLGRFRSTVKLMMQFCIKTLK